MREEVRTTIIECLQKRRKAVVDPTRNPISPSNTYSKWPIDLVGPRPCAAITKSRYIAVDVESYSKTI
jgi:hypothetical protein